MPLGTLDRPPMPLDARAVKIQVIGKRERGGTETGRGMRVVIWR